jgi:hypothetical protein
MFRTKFLLAMLAGIFAWGSSITFAQEEMKDQLYWVREEVAKVDMWDQYETTSKQWVELMTEGGLDLPVVRASQRDDGHYYYLIPLSNYAEIDNFPQIFGSAVEKIGKEKWGEFMKKNDESMETHKDFIVKWSAKYSYAPKEPRVKAADAEFIHWIFFTYKLENRKEVLDVLGEWKALYEKNNMPDGWSTWLIELGEANNMIAVTESAKDGASFYAAMSENSEKLKDEEQKLWAKLSANLLSMEQNYGRPRPDLTYTKK